jgi:hypothetical protein
LSSTQQSIIPFTGDAVGMCVGECFEFAGGDLLRHGAHHLTGKQAHPIHLHDYSMKPV